MIRHLMFDLDGTLFDTAPGIHRAVNILMRRWGFEELPYHLVTALIGNGLVNMLDRLNPELVNQLGDLRRREDEFHDVYRSILLEDAVLMPGAESFLETWPHDLSIVSNKNERYIHQLVEATPLGRFKWNAIIGGDTLAQKKPHPLPVQTALQTSQRLPKESVLIGDGLPDVQVAQATGVHLLAVTFGYSREEDLRAAGAQNIIHHYHDLPEALRVLCS